MSECQEPPRHRGRIRSAFMALCGERDAYAAYVEARCDRLASEVLVARSNAQIAGAEITSLRATLAERDATIQSLLAHRTELDARDRSLRASLDDANATISRLAAEKHSRDAVLRRVIEAAKSVHKGEPQP